MLSAADARLLDRLAVVPRGLAATVGSPALRHANVRGHGLEFHDFRAYQAGDDPRSIDWTVHARLRQLVVRTTRAEAQLRLHLLVDVSLSMTVGNPAKLPFATKVAAALAYIAVGRREAVGVATFDSQIRAFVPPAAGHGQLTRVITLLTAATPQHPSALNAALTGYGSLSGGPGLVIVLSDFLDPAGTLDGLRYLIHRGLQPALVHIASPDEIDPEVADDIELTDVERPLASPLVVSPETVAAYRARLGEWLHALESFCRAEAVPWVSLETTASLERVLASCRRAQLIVSHA